MYTTYFQQLTADTATAQYTGAYCARSSSLFILDAMIVVSFIIMPIVHLIPSTI